MREAIFLSASVPDAKRAPQYAETADTVAITAAVSALVYVTLGRRPLVWGGHPAITPMVWVVAQDVDVDYGRWVRLYQSEFFEDEFPEDNQRFQNVTFTANVEEDREKSLKLMRHRMFSEHSFAAAVFIGGMGGIVEEFELFTQAQPEARVVPLLSTGGAVLDVAARLGELPPELADERDYIALLHRELGISPREERFQSPERQPANIADRYWRPRGI